jgi:ATP/ADP translocase
LDGYTHSMSYINWHELTEFYKSWPVIRLVTSFFLGFFNLLSYVIFILPKFNKLNQIL